MRLFLLLISCALAHAADWPMWRADAGRTATVAPALPEKMRVLWSRELPPLKPAYRDARLQFDRGYEPIVLGQRIFVGSSREDCVIAFDTATGAELWRANADGPVRFAPVAGDGRVIFGSDDGVVRCVAADTGKLVWEKRAVPNGRQLLGNERMISVWPVRGGPVLRDGRVYFAAGVWPLEGVFVFCLDAATGRTIWVNDRVSCIYGVHPHQAEAFGGVAPQGYLLIDGGDLVVPSSSAYPARFDLATGALKEFALPAAGRLPGGWFASTPEAKEAQKLKRRGVIFDSAVNAKRHEDKPWEKGDTGIWRSFRAGDREWSFDEPFPGVNGKVHSVIAADGKCFVVTEEGALYALGAGAGETKTWKRETAKPATNDEFAETVLNASGVERGYAAIIGAGAPGFLETLAERSKLRVLAITNDTAARQRITATQLYGARVSFTPRSSGLPPYFASLVVVAPDAPLPDAAQLAKMFAWLRPYGGQIIGPSALLDVAKTAHLPKATMKLHATGLAVITREGALDGSTNYEGGWIASDDALVRAPLGVLWFGDMVSNFKRSPQPQFIDGVMVTTDKDWLDASTRKGKIDYRLLPPVFSDVYTGRVLDDYEAADLRRRFASTDLKTIQPAQYRPPQQKDDWKPDAPKAGLRTNPLTGESEPRVFPKSYGCDGGFDYGSIYTMRSGTAAFYDKKVESGTIHISGPRSGCTNSIVPANGVLNVPYFYEGCTCSYPLPMGLALVSLPPTFEQWTSWGKMPAASLAGKIERVGINFGAPGDRKTDDGTLWLDWPSVGGPSPEVIVRTEGATETFYRHSVWIEGGEGWPWVAASGVRGLRRATIAGLKPGTYTVRLVFAEPDAESARVFDVRLQDRVALESLNVFAEAKGTMRVLTKTIPQVAVTDGTLTVALAPRTGETILSGIEIIREGLPLAPFPPALVPGQL